MLKGEGVLTFKQAAERFVQFCGSERVILIGHNSKKFDCPFLKAEFGRLGLTIPSNWEFLDSLFVSRGFPWSKGHPEKAPPKNARGKA